MNKYGIGIIVFVLAFFCIWFSLDEQQSTSQPQPIEIDPLIDQDQFLINGLQQRFFVFHRNIIFDRIKTPVENMMIILQSIESFNLCDEAWLKDMQKTLLLLKQQYQLNKYSLDPGVQELMKLQLDVIENMDILIKNSDSRNVGEFEIAFGEYMKYYEENIKEGGTLHEVSLAN